MSDVLNLVSLSLSLIALGVASMGLALGMICFKMHKLNKEMWELYLDRVRELERVE